MYESCIIKFGFIYFLFFTCLLKNLIFNVFTRKYWYWLGKCFRQLRRFSYMFRGVILGWKIIKIRTDNRTISYWQKARLCAFQKLTHIAKMREKRKIFLVWKICFSSFVRFNLYLNYNLIIIAPIYVKNVR